MAVKDVSDAFPLVPLHPSLWRFMLFCWEYVGGEDTMDTDNMWCLYCHIFAGFGMAGLPGVWTILFTHCLMGVARSENVVDLPLVIHVDDVAIIAACKDIVDTQSEGLADFLLYLGVLMKAVETRHAAQLHSCTQGCGGIQFSALYSFRRNAWTCISHFLMSWRIWRSGLSTRDSRRLGAYNAHA